MLQEFNTGPLHREIFEKPIVVEDGYITPPTGPGLGLVLNEEVVEAAPERLTLAHHSTRVAGARARSHEWPAILAAYAVANPRIRF